MSDINVVKVSKWKELKIFFKDRRIGPLEHPEFVFYFLVIIIGFGSIGIWSSFINNDLNTSFDHSNLINNMSSFSVAIIAAGSIELMFIDNKVIRTPLFLISFAIVLFSGISFFLLFNQESPFKYGYTGSIIFVILSLYVWWIANAENANLTKNFFVEQSKKTVDLTKDLDEYDEE